MMLRTAPTSEKPVRTAGKRRELLLYRRVMDRLWGPVVFLGLLLFGVYFTDGFFLPTMRPLTAAIVLSGAVLITAFGLFALAARSMAYIRPHTDHLRLVTPFLNLRISYRRIRAVRPSPVSSIFNPNKMSWSTHNFLEPYLGDTAIVVQLTDYPLNRRILRLFLPEEMFLPTGKGLVFIVREWMNVSTELDSYLDAFRQTAREKR